MVCYAVINENTPRLIYIEKSHFNSYVAIICIYVLESKIEMMANEIVKLIYQCVVCYLLMELYK